MQLTGVIRGGAEDESSVIAPRPRPEECQVKHEMFPRPKQNRRRRRSG